MLTEDVEVFPLKIINVLSAPLRVVVEERAPRVGSATLRLGQAVFLRGELRNVFAKGLARRNGWHKRFR
jgi:hypothetical protein